MPKTEQPGFTTSLKALETILDEFRSGTLSLEESLALFEQGVQHVKACQETLAQSRGRVEELVQSLQDGNFITRPFHDETR